MSATKDTDNLNRECNKREVSPTGTDAKRVRVQHLSEKKKIVACSPFPPDHATLPTTSPAAPIPALPRHPRLACTSVAPSPVAGEVAEEVLGGGGARE